MPHAYIYDAIRTPRGRGKNDGALHEIPPIALATQILQGLRDRNGLDTADLDDVVLGILSPVAEQGACLPRIAAINAGFDESVPGMQLNRFCASGLEAVNVAAGKVANGEADLVIAGGVESMSRIPMGSDGGAWPMDPNAAFASYFVPQGISADLIATKYGFSRDDVDAFAVESQRRAATAWSEGRFARSILPVRDVLGEVVLATDEHMRPSTDMQSLASLNPSFEAIGETMPGFDAVALQKYPELERINHVHHAGNSSGIVDGASGVLIGSKEMGDRLGLKPRARIRAGASTGSEPTIMLTGPEFVTHKLLRRAGMTKADIDLWELNEAFASVVLRYQQALNLDPATLNVNGGAIAYGHPIGATGGMILGIALDELERSDKTTALVSLCIGAGMGTAAVIERV